jgi:uncharacterized protein (TIGR02996 family)
MASRWRSKDCALRSILVGIVDLFDVRIDALEASRHGYAAVFIAHCDPSPDGIEARTQRVRLALESLPGFVLRSATGPTARWLAPRLRNLGASFEMVPAGERWFAFDEKHADRGDQALRILTRGADEPREAFAAELQRLEREGWRVAERERDVIHAASAINEVLETQLADADAKDLHRVYADWLIEQGDVRGELMAVQLAIEEATEEDAIHLSRREKEIFADHRRHLLGPLESCPNIRLTWRFGWIEDVELELYARERQSLEGEILVELISDLLTLPASRLLRGLSCKDAHPAAVAQALDAFGPPRSLHRLTLGLNGWFDQRAGPTTGPIGSLLRRLPNLEELSLTSLDFDLEGVELIRLRSLRLVGAIVASTLAALESARWPALERVELWFASSSEHWVPAFPPPVESLREWMSVDLPALAHLALRAAPHPSSLCELLVGAPYAPRLLTLDLSQSGLDDDAAAVLIAHAHRFESLQQLDLRGTRVSAEAPALRDCFGERVLLP